MPQDELTLLARESRLRTLRDLLTVAAFTVLWFALAAHFELSERIIAWAQAFEWVQADELPTTLIALALALGWFSWRRWVELRRELALRVEVQADLARTLDENRDLARQGLEVQERERKDIARELHDELGQYLNAIQVEVAALGQGLASGRAAGSEATARIGGLANHVYDVARQLMGRLRPVGLDELGLTAALQDLVDGWSQRRPGIRCRLRVADELPELGEETAIGVYRVVQEALTNIAKHAEASEVGIDVAAGGGRLRVCVRDNGRGLPPSPPAGLGLVGMRERAAMLGGRLETRNAGGCEIVMEIPLPGASE